MLTHIKIKIYSIIFMLVMTMGMFAQIERGPYVNNPTPVSMVVKWNSDDIVIGTVDYGTSVDNLDKSISEATATIKHEITIAGLDDATKYYYKVTGQDVGSEDQFFITSPLSGTDSKYEFIVLGDYGQTYGPESYEGGKRVEIVEKWKELHGTYHADLVLALGDLSEDSKDDEYRDHFLNPLNPIIRNTPVIPLLGNHDIHDGDGATWRSTFATPANGEGGGVATGTEDYYSFNYGNIHFVVLSTETDSEETPSYATQGEWLEKDLAANDLPWLVAMFHRPMHSGGHHYTLGKSTPAKERDEWLGILENYGVDLIMSGHNHVLERSMFIKTALEDMDQISDANFFDTGYGRPDVDGAYQKEDGKGYVMLEVPSPDPSKLVNPEDDDGLTYDVYTNMFKVYATEGPEDKDENRLSGFAELVVDGNTLNVKVYNLAENIEPELYDWFTITKDDTPVIRYALNTDIEGNGTVTPPSGTTYKEGNTANIEAIADYGWRFDHWDGDLSGNENPASITMDSEKSVTAVFVETDGNAIEAQVSTSSDDAEEHEDGTVSTTSSDLELVYDGTSAGQQVVGIRFANLQIPQGAIIDEAYITFTAKDDEGYDLQLMIEAEDTDNSSAFTTDAYNITSRPRTASSITWNPEEWVDNQTYNTPDIKSLIQDVIDRSGWVSESALSFIISLDDDTENHAQRRAYSYDSGASLAPALKIMYSNESTTGTIDTEMPITLSLSSNPNPFTNSTTIKFNISQAGNVKLAVYDLMGHQVDLLADGKLQSGSYSIKWDAGGSNGLRLTRGMYIVRIEAGGQVKSIKLILQ